MSRCSDFQFIKTKDNKITLIQKAQPIKFLALSGGGAKCAVYPAALEALQDRGIYAGIEAIGGSSAGAMTALFAAIGMTPKQIAEKADSIDASKLKDYNFTNVRESLGICDGNYILETIWNIIKEQIAGSDGKSGILLEAKTLLNNEQDHKRRAAFQKALDDIKVNIDEGNFTFANLKKLREVYQSYATGMNKNKIKDLLMTGTNIDKLKCELFTVHSDPDMNLALAARISGSFPVVFKAVMYKGSRYIDGGAYNNLPISAMKMFADPANFEFLEDKRFAMETLSFVLQTKSSVKYIDDNMPLRFKNALSSFDKTLYTNHDIRRRNFFWQIIHYLIRTVLFVSALENKIELARSLRKNFALRTVVLPTSGVTTLQFDITKNQREKMLQKSKEVMNEFINLRKQEAYYEKFDDVESLLLSLPHASLQRLLKNHLAIQELSTVQNASFDEIKVAIKKMYQARYHEVNYIHEIKKLLTQLNADLSVINLSLQEQKDIEQLVTENYHEINSALKYLAKLSEHIDKVINITDNDHKAIVTNKISTACGVEVAELIENLISPKFFLALQRNVVINNREGKSTDQFLNTHKKALQGIRSATEAAFSKRKEQIIERLADESWFWSTHNAKQYQESLNQLQNAENFMQLSGGIIALQAKFRVDQISILRIIINFLLGDDKVIKRIIGATKQLAQECGATAAIACSA